MKNGMDYTIPDSDASDVLRYIFLTIIYMQICKDWYSWGLALKVYKRNWSFMNMGEEAWTVIMLIIVRLGIIIICEIFSYIIILSTPITKGNL
jgi:hypothetical protein